MKKVIFALAILLTSGAAIAQQVNYSVVYDNPPTPKLNINLEWMQIDMGIKNIDGSSLNIGSFGFWEPLPGLGIQYNAKKSVVALGKLGFKDYPGNTDLSLGAYLMPINHTKIKTIKILLSREYKGSQFSRSLSGNLVEKRIEELTFLMVPGTRRSMKGIRGGLYFKRGAYANDEVDLYPVDEMALTSMGVYAGLNLRSIKNTFIDAENYGVRYNSIGDDIVLDFLFVPVNIMTDLNDPARPNVSQLVRDAGGGDLPFGFRIGWYRYQIEKRSYTGKKFGMSAGFEAGLKPYQGVFFNGSLGITLVKN